VNKFQTFYLKKNANQDDDERIEALMGKKCILNCSDANIIRCPSFLNSSLGDGTEGGLAAVMCL